MDEINPKMVTAYRRLSRYSSWALIIIGIAVLIGWIGNINLLKSVLPGAVSMKANTAICFLITGLNLVLLHTSPSLNFRRRYLLLVLSGVFIVLLLALGNLTQYLFGINLHIDELFFKDIHTHEDAAPPGRMPINTAVNFTLAGLAILLYTTSKERYYLAQLLALGIFVTAQMSFLAWTFNVENTNNTELFTQMAIHTMIGSLLLAISLIFIYPEQGFVHLFSGKYLGSVLSRQLFWYAFFLPMVIAASLLALYREQVFSAEYAIMLNSAYYTVIAMTVLWFNLKRVNVIDATRTQTEQAINQLNDDLIASNEELTNINEELITSNQMLEAANITIQRLTEEALEQSARAYRELADSIPDVFFATNRNLVCTYWNKACERFKGIPAHEAIGKNVFELFPHLIDFEQSDILVQLLDHNKPVALEKSFLVGKKVYYFELMIYPSLTGISFIMHDITQRVLDKEKLELSLQEKQILIKEIHHRVKNNMALISSMLRLQAGYLHDDEAIAAFEASQHRIMSMAMIHEKLYQSETLSMINFKDYIHELTHNIAASYEYSAKTINLVSECQDIFLDIITAIPCGLIINELVSNAYKHAFKGRQSGEIIVQFRKEEDFYHLLVKDNGIGLPPDYTIEQSNSLGMILVHELANQLDADIKIKADNGTSYLLTFKAMAVAN